MKQYSILLLTEFSRFVWKYLF